MCVPVLIAMQPGVLNIRNLLCLPQPVTYQVASENETWCDAHQVPIPDKPRGLSTDVMPIKFQSWTSHYFPLHCATCHAKQCFGRSPTRTAR